VLLYANSEQSEIDIKKTIPLIIAMKINKNKIPENKFNQRGERAILCKL
jgi:hypothetical protein